MNAAGGIRPYFIGTCAQRACVWEVTARKAGNVHPGRDFADLRYTDFLASAAAIAPVLDQADKRRVGPTVLRAIEATRAVCAANTNLGIVLLLAPLAAVPEERTLRAGLGAVLTQLDVDDARNVYKAIRLAQPGGLGKVASQDVTDEPTLPLGQVMALAADRDLVARQYANGFQEVFEIGVPCLLDGAKRFGGLEDAIIFAHLHFLARFPDSLIQRKCGLAQAQHASQLAQETLNAGWPLTPAGRAAFTALDAWLIAAGNRRNPGTSADLVTASLFAALRAHTLDSNLPWVTETAGPILS